jgi:predicted HicB family RNase H-like nuclease
LNPIRCNIPKETEMLNRKLTEADIGKTFELYGVPDGHYMELVILHAIEGDRCYFRCEDQHPVETDLTGNGDFVPCSVSEIEEFKITGEEVWRSSTDKEEKELNGALGLKELNLKIDSAIFDALEEKAKLQGIILKDLVRQILTDHVANQ